MSELLKEKQKQELTPPKMWAVVMHNDDFTTFEFVMECLIGIFNKTEEQAAQITLDIHQKGKGIVGQYTREIAETRKAMAEIWAKENEYPLLLELQLA